MFLAMVKKEFKQFFRSKSDVLMMFVFPIVLITTLSVGLKSMMTSGNIFGTGDKYSTVYYTLDESSKYKDGFINFMKGTEESVNIKFEKVTSQEAAINDVDQNNGMLHININNEGFSIYTSKNGEKTQSKVFRSICESMLNEYATYETIGKLNPKALTNLIENKYDEYVIQDENNGSREVTSSEYYTFAELALIILYVSQTVGESIFKETQLLTINRIRLSKVKEVTMLCSKISFGVFISILQTLLIYIYSSTILKVNWGENTLKFILLFIVLGIFVSVVGAIVGLLAKKETTIGGIINTIIFFLCFLGGCYIPLILIIGMPVINKLMYLSPIYWINTATSTLICGITSDAYIIALSLPVVLSIISLILCIPIIKKRESL